jgi:hypothetical protein
MRDVHRRDERRSSRTSPTSGPRCCDLRPHAVRFLLAALGAAAWHRSAAWFM